VLINFFKDGLVPEIADCPQNFRIKKWKGFSRYVVHVFSSEEVGSSLVILIAKVFHLTGDCAKTIKFCSAIEKNALGWLRLTLGDRAGELNYILKSYSEGENSGARSS
jgi:hypothetical protein